MNWRAFLGGDFFENADCDTIGGFITETLGRIPQAGETLPLETLGYTSTVAEATPRAVTKVTITCTAEKTADPQPALSRSAASDAKRQGRGKVSLSWNESRRKPGHGLVRAPEPQKPGVAIKQRRAEQCALMNA